MVCTGGPRVLDPSVVIFQIWKGLNPKVDINLPENHIQGSGVPACGPEP